ncbi:MAG TPA: nucleoside monophosphate kinase [Rubrobacteraceae bacterium]|nr:nucleoside monophosphate kinase [Rubrobacteraceae bacterium]
MKIALLGPVGVGKGTQAQRVAGRLNYVRVSTGDLVRDQIEANTELGQELKGYSDQGDQVPDETIMDLIRVHLQPAGAWILDGVPRTVEQARDLDEELEKHGTALDKVIMLEGPEDEDLIERVVNGRRQSLATGRVYHLEYDPPPDPVEGQDPGPFVQREDDTEEALRRQLEAYRKEAEAIKEHYEEKGILTVIDADQEVEKTTENILEALGNPQKHP